MSTHYSELEGTGRPRRSLLSLLFVPLLAFAAGLVAMGWLLANWSAAAGFIGVKAPPSAETQDAPALPVVVSEPPAATGNVQAAQPAIDAELNRRVQMLEQRIGSIASKTREAVGNADRAEGLLIAFAARRALDRGVGLGYLEGLLRQRFGTTQPQAVATVIAASNQPVTLQELQQGLQELSPQLVGGGLKQSWWSSLRHELNGLVTIRRTDSPSTMPSERLERAMQRLEAGQVNVALAELNRLPGRDQAASWFAAARRYVAARDALDRIETAALLDPRQAAELAAGASSGAR